MHVRRLLGSAAILLALSFTTTAKAVSYGTNLLVNGNAEAGSASSTGDAVAVPGWKTSSAFTVVPYGAAGGFPTASQGPADGMNQFFAGGSAAVSTATQDIDISANASDIDTGHVAVDAAGWFGGYANQDDQAALTVTFENKALTQLGSFTIGGVTAAERAQQTQLLNRGDSMFVPNGTRILHIALTMTRKSNSAFNDGYADSLTVTLRGPALVTTKANLGAGSFRDALALGAYITFDPNVFGSAGNEIVVSALELPDIVGAMTIEGPGARNVTISRYQGFSSNGAAPILVINPPPRCSAPVNISGITLNAGATDQTVGATITTSDTYSGKVTVRDVVIEGAFSNDGIDVGYGASLDVSGCTFRSNARGIYCWANATVRNCTFSNSGSAFVSQVPVDVRSATIDSCTFNENYDAINFEISPVPQSSILVTVSNCIFQSPLHLNFDDQSQAAGGKVASSGYNLSSIDDSAILNATGDRNNTDAKLAPLGDYGGTTPTHALLAGSLAIDKGKTMLAVDQRGLPRPVDDPNSLNGGGNNSDIGAFELQPGEIVIPATPTPSPTSTPTATPTPSVSPTATPTATPSATPAALLLNISTRMEVLTGDNVLIAGFIVTGIDKKQVLLRALGPELPLAGVLGDPTLTLHDTSSTIATNNDWKQTQQAQIEATGIPPTSDLEAAIVATLDAKPASSGGAAYTAVVTDANASTGVGQVEVYDLAQNANSTLANISTRGFVDTGDNVMIGGFIVGNAQLKVLIRAIGPSLGIAGALANPFLELHDGNGTLQSNDDWKTDQQAEIAATGIPPGSDLESAIVRTLAPGNYTAIVRGVDNGVGVALVEIYHLE